MLFVCVVTIWLLVVAIAVCIDFGPEIYEERKTEREKEKKSMQKASEARELILTGITKYSRGKTTDLGLIVIQAPVPKRPAGAHRKVRTI